MRSVGCGLLLMGVLASRGARGDGNDGLLIERGLQLRREHRDAEALDVFRRANDVNPTPRARAQIALAEQALGQWVEAEGDLRGALASTNDPWIASRREALGTALEAIRKHLATLIVTADVASGEVWVNGVRLGKVPLTARVPAGSSHVEVRAKGYQTALRAIEVGPGATEEIQMTVVAEAPPIAKPLSAGGEATSDPPATVVDRTPGPVEPPDPTSPVDATRRTFAWVSLGAAGAFLGGAVVAQVYSEERSMQYNDDSQCLFGALSRDERCGVYRGQAESAQTLATVGYVAAGALGIGSAILFLMGPSKAKPSVANVRLDVGASGLRLDVAGAF